MLSRNRSTVFFASALGAGVLTVIGLLMFTGDDDSTEPGTSAFRSPSVAASGSPSSEPTTEPARFATESGANREGGYSFGYPPKWEVVTDGSVSTLTSPRSDVVITIGFAAQGGLGEAATDLSELVRSSYQVLRMGPPTRTSVGGASALVFKGLAKNDESATITFEVTTVEGSEDNYAISVFSYPARTSSLDDVIEEIVGSFTVTAAS